MAFTAALRAVQPAAGLPQAGFWAIAGVARHYVVAYERGRRETRFDSAMALLDAAGADVVVEPPVVWSWTTGMRPYAVPLRLWRLDPAMALRSFEPGLHLWWSGPSRPFDLAVRTERCRIYEIVLREGRPEDIESVVDSVLLLEAWPDLVLPRGLLASWSSLIATSSSDRSDRIAS